MQRVYESACRTTAWHWLSRAVLGVVAGCALAAAPGDLQAQVGSTPKMWFIQAPPSPFGTPMHAVTIGMESRRGGMECGPSGDWCWYYDYEIDTQSFSFKVNGQSQTSAFGTPSLQSDICDWSLGTNGTDWECVRTYSVSGTATLTLGTQNTLLAEALRAGSSGPVPFAVSRVVQPMQTITYGVTVTARSSSNGPPFQFDVKNTGNVPATFLLSATCSGTWIVASACTVADSVTMPAGVTQTVTVTTSRMGPRATAVNIRLQATHSSQPAVTDEDLGGGWWPLTQVSTPVPPPIVVISPKRAALVSTDTLTMRIGVCADEDHQDNPAWRVIKVGAEERTADFSTDSIKGHTQVAVGDTTLFCETWEVLKGKVAIPRGLTKVSVDFITWNGYQAVGLESAPIEAHLMRPPASPGVRVAAGPGSPGRPLSAATQQPFLVVNTGDTVAVYNLEARCDGFAGTVCNPGAPRVRVEPGDTATVVVAYTTAAVAGSGTMRLVARDSVRQAIRDSAWIDVRYRAPAPVVDLANAGDGTTVAREQCLAFGIVPRVATECGGLRIAFPLPSTRTSSTVRTPTLVYYDEHASDTVNVFAHVTIPSGIGTPDSVRTILFERKDGGVLQEVARRTDAGRHFVNGRTQRVGLALGGVRTADSRILRYRVRVQHRTSAGQWQTTGEADGELPIVVRSRLSPGWHVAGIEELHSGQPGDAVLWIGGDGSTRAYIPDAGASGGGITVYRAAAVTRPDSLVKQTVGSSTWYWRRLPDGTRVYFSATGLHDSTVNRHGHKTRFEYATINGVVRLKRIILPPVGQKYEFNYTTGGYLNSISAPTNQGQSRITTLRRSTQWPARIERIVNAVGDTVRLEYPAAGASALPVAFVDERGTRTVFTRMPFTPMLATATTQLQSGTAADIVHTFRQVRGLAAAPAAAPVPLDSVFTRYDGPRTDVADITRFWLDRFGAPVRILNAEGRVTSVTRGDIRFPGLVTAVRNTGGLLTTATYSDSGLPLSVIVHDPLGTGAGNAVTTYEWHGQWPFPTKVTGPDGVVTQSSYSASTGNMTWTQTGGSARRVYFSYASSGPAKGLPTSMTLPDTAGSERYTYDAFGNLRSTESPLGSKTFSYADSLGRDTLVVVPTDSSGVTDEARIRSFGLRTRSVYDPLGRVDTLVRSAPGLKVPQFTGGPASRVVPADGVVVATTYDAVGNPVTVTRRYTTPPNVLQTLISTTQYDRAGRVVAQTEAGQNARTYEYDPAGNVVMTTSPGGYQVKATYDALNRVVRKTIPTVWIGQMSCAQLWELALNCNFVLPTVARNVAPQDLCIRADTLTFAYDAAGNLVRADNYAAQIRRRYNPGGMLVGDSLRTRTYHTVAQDQPCDPSSGDMDPGPEDWNTFAGYRHHYVHAMTYDVAGRRLSLTMPWQLSGGQVQQYHYSATTGELTTITAPSGETVTFAYDRERRLVRTSLPGGIKDSLAYDTDGRLVARLLTGSSHDETVAYTRDDAGRVREAAISSATLGQYTAKTWYGPLGAVVAAENVTWNQGVDGALAPGGFEGFETDALGNRLRRWQEYVHPNAPDRDGERTFQLSFGRVDAIVAQYDPHYPSFVSRQLFNYDEAGNQWLSRREHVLPPATSELETTISYYDAADRLVAVNRHVGALQVSNPGGVFEEYRYDALGRRVLVRSRGTFTDVAQQGAGGPWSYLERTIWDGDRVLAELRTNGGHSATDGGLEAPEPASAPSGHTDAPYGRVQYVHAFGSAAAGGIDQPLLVERSGVSGGTIVYTPLVNWRGEVQAAAKTPSSATLPPVSWPGSRRTVDGAPTTKLMSGVSGTGYYWMGNLATGLTDGSGLQYRRNRYYDPATGQFTQSDPIGLGGGLNLYGFAGGDPVSYRDPFGLCPDSVKTDQGSCPGGVTTEEWNAVESTYACMSPEAAGATRGLLFSGNIRGAVLPDSSVSGRVTNRAPGTIFINRSHYQHGNIFFHSELGPTLVHEVRHVRQLEGRTGWALYEFMRDNRDALEQDAVGYERANYLCGR